MRPAAIILLLGLVGCRAPRTSGSGALVSGPAEVRESVVEIIAEVEPRITEALGTSWPREFEVVIDPSFEGHGGETRDFDRRVRLGARALIDRETLEILVAHELVHVHMTGDWRALPGVIQEGVAYWISGAVTGYGQPVWDAEPPEPELVRRAFAMDYDTYERLPPDEACRVRHAAMYVAASMVEFGDLPPRRTYVEFRNEHIDDFPVDERPR